MESAGKARHPSRTPRSNVVKVLHWGDNPPSVICLCGPWKFKAEFLSAFRAFTVGGHVVVMPGVFGTADGGFLDGETKRKIEELQYRKIEMADSVYVINPNGYLDEPTKREIEYAESLGKTIRYYDAK
jgi:hypothetical protein